jgi:hypothetical protein
MTATSKSECYRSIEANQSLEQGDASKERTIVYAIAHFRRPLSVPVLDEALETPEPMRTHWQVQPVFLFSPTEALSPQISHWNKGTRRRNGQ